MNYKNLIFLFQNDDPGPRYEGGCPFKILDIEQLKDVFNSCLIDDEIQEELIKLKETNAGAACGLFLQTTNDDKSDIIVQSPLEYYVHVTKKDWLLPDHNFWNIVRSME